MCRPNFVAEWRQRRDVLTYEGSATCGRENVRSSATRFPWLWRGQAKVTWPGGADLAISFVVNFGRGAENAYEDGQPTNDKLGEFVSSLPDGMRDLAMEQLHEYGLRAGVWRILDLFERYGRRSTFYMCGRAVERLAGTLPARSSRAVTNLRRMGTVGSATLTSRITTPRRSSCRKRARRSSA